MSARLTSIRHLSRVPVEQRRRSEFPGPPGPTPGELFHGPKQSAKPLPNSDDTHGHEPDDKPVPAQFPDDEKYDAEREDE